MRKSLKNFVDKRLLSDTIFAEDFLDNTWIKRFCENNHKPETINGVYFTQTIPKA